LDGEKELLQVLEQIHKQTEERVWRGSTAQEHKIFLIWGIVGIGKTRLGKEIFLRLHRKHEHTFYLFYKFTNRVEPEEIAALPF